MASWAIFGARLLLWIPLLSSLPCIANASYLDSLSPLQREVFDYGMSALDVNFAGGPDSLLFDGISDSIRYSAWYAVGLLARNEGDDVDVASGMLKKVVANQFTNPSKVWYGTFRDTLETPDPQEGVFNPTIYGSYDPNRALFVGTAMIIIMEEFQDLLEPDLVDLMKESMYIAAVGDGYRNGGINNDNLYPVYSNPWFMRVMAATYVGNMMQDDNMTHWGNVWAEQGIAEFDRYDKLNEFNSATYAGVTLYALSLWGYMPKNSTIVTRAADMIKKTWEHIGMFYNPTLHTLGGPWDRAYGYDMRSYLGILGIQIAGLIGGIKDKSAPLPVPLVGSNHFADAAIMPMLPITSKFHDPYVSSSVLSSLKSLSSSSSSIEGHTYFTQAVSPPYDSLSFPRNYTSYTGPGLSVGGVQVDEAKVGGPSLNPSQFQPAQVLWATGNIGGGGREEVGWILHYPSSSVINASASPTSLTVSYPPSQAFPGPNATVISNSMSFLFSGIKGVSLGNDFLMNGTAELPGLKLTVGGSVVNAVNEGKGNRTFVYGEEDLNNFLFYNLTWFFERSELEEIPEVRFEFEKL
ncbi:hypothetical protein K435DRAFT_970410 [Dendrothele bispora CBS 962.96]|uniref:Uncharacterized protein n=1 Tax=Dendrothele bispora (strain CBS 962.96) TaxID=1314807 RepID=A0A4S8LBK3_DENBC|nr:hypothetical protein K435DRAFT_970410 [Dendrothele bispora CBS 962.96]